MRYHLSSLLVMCLVASVLLGLNLSPFPHHPSWEVLAGPPRGSWWYCYGWPAPYCTHDTPDFIAAFTTHLRLLPFSLDMAYALFLIVGAGWTTERWLAVRDALKRCTGKPHKLSTEGPTP